MASKNKPKLSVSKKPDKEVLQEAGILCEVCRIATKGQLCNDCQGALERLVTKTAD